MKSIFVFVTLMFAYGAFADQMADTSGYDLKLAEKLSTALRNNDLEFRLVNQYGSGVSLSDFGDKSDLALVSLLPGCSEKDIVKKGSKLSKTILFLNPNFDTNREDLIKKYPKANILIDENQQVSNSLQLTHAGDYVLLDPKTQKIKKAGKLLSQKELSNCKIPYVTYVPGTFKSEVIPAIRNTCLSCHSNNGNLDYFQDTKTISSWKQMFLRTIRLRRMPPGADPYYSVITAHTAKDILTLTKWLESGPLIEGDDEKDYISMMQKRTERRKNRSVKSEDEKANDTKKIELFNLPAEKISAIGGDYFKQYSTDKPTTQDYYFNTYDIEVNDNVAHHISLHYSPTPFPSVDKNGSFIATSSSMVFFGKNPEPITGDHNGVKIKGFKFKDPNIIYIARKKGRQYAPRNTSYFIPKGSYLNLEVHYNPSGRDEESVNQLTIMHDEKLRNTPPIRRFSMMPDYDVVVAKPFEKNSIVTMKYTLKENIELLGYGIHTHYRARSGKLFVRLPKEKNKKLIFSFPTYQYKIQLTSYFKTPLYLPIGSEIIHEMHYDNSKENLANPDPTKTIKIGTSVLNDENYLPRFMYVEK